MFLHSAINVTSINQSEYIISDVSTLQLNFFMTLHQGIKTAKRPQ